MSNSKSNVLMSTVRVIAVLLMLVASAQNAFADNLPVKRRHVNATDSIATAPDSVRVTMGTIVVGDSVAVPEGQPSPDFTQAILAADTIPLVEKFADFEVWEAREVNFNPDPTRAVWMSALCPGLGQIYNRRYWKIPIVIGAYMGLGYATTWNNNMLTDYTRAYRDIMDNDPDTKSYMNFFPPNTAESSLDKTWLTNILSSRKNFYRRNRDLCIIAMIGVYLVAMVDAYVDASLSHFDITPQLTMDMAPMLMIDAGATRPGLGLACALTF